ncbi:MAG TPA: hypothetical protein VFQ42_22595, partial [Mycobacterium sp.]|nr:hypothetical protein [Mycobacterium sp.]
MSERTPVGDRRTYFRPSHYHLRWEQHAVKIFGLRRRDQRSGHSPRSERVSPVAVHGGHENLDVVGESHYQDSLWRIVGGAPPDRVDAPVVAVLKAETDNPFDVNAISVWVDGLLVGHLPRDLAAAYRTGLIAQERQAGRPIALNAHVVGGGMRDDGPGMLGVFLDHDPTDFGVAHRGAFSGAVYEGESGALRDH